MSQLFRKEALERRSRALFGEVVLSSPLSLWLVSGLILITLCLILALLFTVDVNGQTVWDWLRD
jgi:hypothetical protein